jgi:phospholipid/cholesterol/gamma-HCH transport system substrate-binding protein
MNEKRHASKVGLFVFIGLVLIAALLLNFSRSAGLFKSKYRITMNTRSVAGLKEGADVSLSGVRIGNATRIELDHTNKGVRVELTILAEFPLRKDSRFVIEQQGVLGDQFVNVSPGSPDEPLLKNGDVVEGVEPFNLQEVAQSANTLIKRFEQLGATVTEAITRLNNQVLDGRTLSNLSLTIDNIEGASSRAVVLVDNASGMISNSSPVLALSMTNLLNFSRKLDKVAMDVDETILTNRVELNEAMKNLRDATASLKQMTADMQSGKGLIGGLLKDEELRTDLSVTVNNLAILSSNLNRFGLLYKPKQPPNKTPPAYPGKTPFK